MAGRKASRKNILPWEECLCYQELSELLKFGLFDKIVVSSEDDEILMLAKGGAIGTHDQLNPFPIVQQW